MLYDKLKYQHQVNILWFFSYWIIIFHLHRKSIAYNNIVINKSVNDMLQEKLKLFVRCKPSLTLLTEISITVKMFSFVMLHQHQFTPKPFITSGTHDNIILIFLNLNVRI